MTREAQIEAARAMIESGVSEEMRKALEKEYPELMESEDERIRMRLMKIFDTAYDLLCDAKDLIGA